MIYETHGIGNDTVDYLERNIQSKRRHGWTSGLRAPYDHEYHSEHGQKFLTLVWSGRGEDKCVISGILPAGQSVYKVLASQYLSCLNQVSVLLHETPDI